eukprot:TRINITY_DN53985_c0_g1_i1.p1 TRINITY_DN53985_c0_g1~~TRINITY_DN53985_c0_g1_i1.p1  ORF type:complete len:380 (+),score=57.63 TRINITY_DN53985_c0_g1_i1:60-1199(+)
MSSADQGGDQRHALESIDVVLSLGDFAGPRSLVPMCAASRSIRHAVSSAEPVLQERYPSRLYVLGGMDGSRCLESMEEFNPLTGTWKVSPPMTCARAGAAAATVDGRICIVGGVHLGEVIQSGEIFCPLRQEWQALPPLLQPRKDAVAVGLEGRLYVCGGSNDSAGPPGSLRCVERFDFLSHSWQEMPSMAEKRVHASAAAASGSLLVCGGRGSAPYDTLEALSTVEIFDPGKNTWKAMPNMNEARCCASAASAGSYVYVVGGNRRRDGHTSVLASVERLNLSSRPFKSKETGASEMPLSWEILPPMPEPRCFATAAAMAGKIYVFGGSSLREPLKDALRLDLYRRQDTKLSPEKRAEWEVLASLISRRTGASSAAVEF